MIHVKKIDHTHTQTPIQQKGWIVNVNGLWNTGFDDDDE